METKVAITSSDGAVIDQHFGHCSEFRIAEIESSGQWKIAEVRKTERTCNNFSHSEAHVQEVVKLLSDCRYLLTYRIGFYPYSLFRSRGIDCLETPTEEPVTIAWAMERLRAFMDAHSTSKDFAKTPIQNV